MYQKPGDYQKAVHEETADFMMCVCLPGIPDGSVGKESPCDAGDPVSIPGLGRSPGEGKGYPLWYSGLENSVHGQKESDTTERLSLHFTSRYVPLDIFLNLSAA